MSRILSRFKQRPGKSTKDRQAAPKGIVESLPPLRCRVFQNGVEVEPAVQPDPRAGFCEAFGRQAAKFGFTATPILTIEINLPPLCCGIFTADGKLQRITETPDPRERYCQTFNELQAGTHYTRPLDADELEIARKLLAEREVAHG